jgi:hypothetical protein
MASQMDNATILAMRTQRETSVRLIEAYARENAVVLQNAGQAATERNLYLAHFLGGRGAVSALQADPRARAADVLGPEAARANPTVIGGGRSIQDVLDYASRRTAQNDPGVRALRERATVMQEELRLTDLSTYSTEQLRTVQELLNSERQRGSDIGRQFATASELITADLQKLTPELREQVKVLLQQADAYARVAQASASSRLGREIAFEREQIGRDPIEQQVHARLRSSGIAADSREGAQLADDLRLNEYLRQTKDLADGALKGFLGDLRAGRSLSEALHNALSRVVDRVSDAILNRGLSALLGTGQGGAGGGGFLAGALRSLFATGPGMSPTGAESAAGLNTAMTTGSGLYHRGGIFGREPSGWRNIHPAYFEDAPRYHAGRLPGRLPWDSSFEGPAIIRHDEGVFTPAQMRALGGRANAAPITVRHQVINNAPGLDIATEEEPDGRGGMTHRTIINRMVAGGLRSEEGRSALGEHFASPKRVRNR